MAKVINKPFVLCIWNDAHNVSGTTELSEHEIPHRSAIYTVYGFVLKHDAVGITLANEVSEENTYRSINFIPAGMIVEVVPLKVSIAKPKKSNSLAPQPPQTSPSESSH